MNILIALKLLLLGNALNPSNRIVFQRIVINHSAAVFVSHAMSTKLIDAAHTIINGWYLGQ